MFIQLGKDAIDVIADYLQGLYAWARREIENDLRELHFGSSFQGCVLETLSPY